MVLFKVAVEEKMPEPPKAAKKPEPAVVPPKEEPAKKGTFYFSDGPFFSNKPRLCLFLFCCPLNWVMLLK